MQKHKVILLVEDNRQDELLTLRALKSNGFGHEVVICRDGAEAVDWLEADGIFAGRDPLIIPQVILLDLKLPKLDGHEVLERIRKHPKYSHLPVVILTTSKEESEIVKSYQHGANSFVQKPVSYDEFSEAVKRLGLFWVLTNESPSVQTSNSANASP